MSDIPRFVICDRTVTDYGFVVIPEGIRLDRFLKNPVMFYNHDRWSDGGLPIGKWIDLKIEDVKLTGLPVFDEKDEFAKKIKQKVLDGYLNACSLMAEPLQVSNEEQYLLPDSRRATVIESELLEISIVSIPGNKNSVRLQRNGKQIELSSDSDNDIIPFISSKNEKNMKVFALKLGMSESATESEILEKMTQMLSLNKSQEGELVQLRSELSTLKDKAANDLVEEAIKLGRITADKKDSMIALAKADLSATKTLLDSMPALQRPNVNQTTRTAGGSDNADQPKSWDDLVKLGSPAVDKIKKEQPDLYASLYEEKFKRKL
jgi:hypothetical protein